MKRTLFALTVLAGIGIFQAPAAYAWHWIPIYRTPVSPAPATPTYDCDALEGYLTQQCHRRADRDPFFDLEGCLADARSRVIQCRVKEQFSTNLTVE